MHEGIETFTDERKLVVEIAALEQALEESQAELKAAQEALDANWVTHQEVLSAREACADMRAELVTAKADLFRVNIVAQQMNEEMSELEEFLKEAEKDLARVTAECDAARLAALRDCLCIAKAHHDKGDTISYILHSLIVLIHAEESKATK